MIIMAGTLYTTPIRKKDIFWKKEDSFGNQKKRLHQMFITFHFSIRKQGGKSVIILLNYPSKHHYTIRYVRKNKKTVSPNKSLSN